MTMLNHDLLLARFRYLDRERFGDSVNAVAVPAVECRGVSGHRGPCWATEMGCSGRMSTMRWEANQRRWLPATSTGTAYSTWPYPTTGPIRSPSCLVTETAHSNGMSTMTSAGVAVLLGNGDGTFRPHVDYPANAGKVEVADFNQDGKLDLIGVGAQEVDILLGNGEGTFQPVVSFPTGNRPWSALPADFNGDGRLDIATGNFDDGTVSVLLAQPTTRRASKPHRK
jgi:hypothetical protein